MCKLKRSNNDIWIIVIVLVVACAFPFLLNWVLLLPAKCRIVGNEETWLGFWATYVGAILTALMVVATFITIRKTVNLSLSQRKIDWLHSFREASADLIRSVDVNMVNSLVQSITFGESSVAAEKGYALAKDVNYSSFILTSLLKEYDDLFNEPKSKDYIKGINDSLKPFLQLTGEMIQFATISDYLEKKRGEGKTDEGLQAIIKMEEEISSGGYPINAQALSDFKNNPIDTVIHDTSIRLLEELQAVDSQSLEDLLHHICQNESKSAHTSALVLFLFKKNDD